MDTLDATSISPVTTATPTDNPSDSLVSMIASAIFGFLLPLVGALTAHAALGVIFMSLFYACAGKARIRWWEDDLRIAKVIFTYTVSMLLLTLMFLVVVLSQDEPVTWWNATGTVVMACWMVMGFFLTVAFVVYLSTLGVCLAVSLSDRGKPDTAEHEALRDVERGEVADGRRTSVSID